MLEAEEVAGIVEEAGAGVAGGAGEESLLAGAEGPEEDDDALTSAACLFVFSGETPSPLN